MVRAMPTLTMVQAATATITRFSTMQVIQARRSLARNLASSRRSLAYQSG